MKCVKCTFDRVRIHPNHKGWYLCIKCKYTWPTEKYIRMVRKGTDDKFKLERL